MKKLTHHKLVLLVGLLLTTTLTSSVYAQTPLPAQNLDINTIEHYSVISTEEIQLRKKAIINSGIVGVINLGDEDSEVSLKVGMSVDIEENAGLSAPTIHLKKKSVVSGDIYSIELTRHKSAQILGNEMMLTENDFPLIELPAIGACTVGTDGPVNIREGRRAQPISWKLF